MQSIEYVTSRSLFQEQPIELAYLLDRPLRQPIKGVIAVIPRGAGAINLQRVNGKVVHEANAILFVTQADYFKRHGYAIAVLDKPADQPSLSVDFRRSLEHRQDMAAMLADLHRRFATTPIWLAGSDSAAVSVMHAARDLRQEINGAMLLGGDFDNLRSFDFSHVTSPVLLVHHQDDTCNYASFYEAVQIANTYRFDMARINGGQPASRHQACANDGLHAFNGRQRNVAETIVNWLEGRKPTDDTSTDPALFGVMNEHVVQVPAEHRPDHASIETTVFRPDGLGPFPLIVLNHGKPADIETMMREQKRWRPMAQITALVERGFAVAVPMRRGFGRSGGKVPPASCDIDTASLIDARDIHQVVSYFQSQSYVDRQRVVLMGQSAGGLASLAYASQAYTGVRAVINFSGGLRLHGGLAPCWPQSLYSAISRFGHEAHTPSLWFYSENDRLFPPDVAQSMYQQYRRAGGNAQFVALPPSSSDGHQFFVHDHNVPLWLPQVEHFLVDAGVLQPNISMLARNTLAVEATRP
ncbi:alpha/beta fold hydrolase [Chitinivorax sp. B]|uniref:alpha/beta hydrolase n=1 Tax=Chitinivorax sp. B TaxID=2502235 RepID=UPI0014852F3B|nr:alpha/beta fold hydrolase [Chitinivorax sp. B]